ncbi:hypothetical protein ACLOJK_003063 [Asimina triloba]
MAYFPFKRLTPQKLEAECGYQSEQLEVKRIFRSEKFQAELCFERKSILESRIRRLKRKNDRLRNELHEQGAGAAETEQQEIIAQLQSKDEQLRKLRAEQEKLAEEKMEWEKLLGAMEKFKLVSEEVVGMERMWKEAAAVLKRTGNGSGGDETVEKVFGADHSMVTMMEPFLDSLKAIEGRFQKMELQMKDMRQARELLSDQKLEEDGFVDVGDLLEVEKALERWL